VLWWHRTDGSLMINSATLVCRDITPRGAVILTVDFGTEPAPSIAAR